MDGKGCLADSGCPAWWGQAAERSWLPPHCPGVSRGWENKGIWRDPYIQKRLVEPPGRKWRYLNSKEKKKDFSSSASLPKCTPGLSHLCTHTRCPGPEPIILQQRLEGSVPASQASPAMGIQSWKGAQRERRNSRKVNIYMQKKKKIKLPKYDYHSPLLNEKRLVCLFVCNFLFPQTLYQMEKS